MDTVVTVEMVRLIAKAITVVGLAAVSAWLAINGKDGSGWAFLAFLVLILV